ncbi:WD40-repeat-containing domain protein [Mycotypha africana]|uniref:WD40-repeat-containing domain protein n=1 Tax=Mycotypha africana TaxID=64632 RepID=UPI0022FFF25F|nr:WD40-repeat-containing domain protein [Mycotypha africana]KAI8967891.1 WD40-repeat-containing domain protein [Mycotypha africana]
MWRIEDNGMKIDLLECFRGHTSVVNTVASSRAYGILVSGSDDKTAIIWDINRKQYVRSLSNHENGVDIVQINNTSGDIITCSGHTIRVWTINGDLYFKKSACNSSESILACIFYEQKLSEWSKRELIITGHRNGIVKFWAKHSKHGEWSLELVKEMAHINRADSSFNKSDIVSLFLSPSKGTLFTGNRHGLVYTFVSPDTTDTYHYEKDDKHKECMECCKIFGVLERRLHCKTCGGIFCSACMSSSLNTFSDKPSRLCSSCHTHLVNCK